MCLIFAIIMPPYDIFQNISEPVCYMKWEIKGDLSRVYAAPHPIGSWDMLQPTHDPELD